MIRRLLVIVLALRRGDYSNPVLLGRNIRAWWSRRGGWLVNSLLLDEVFTLRCMHSLKGGAA